MKQLALAYLEKVTGGSGMVQVGWAELKRLLRCEWVSGGAYIWGQAKSRRACLISLSQRVSKHVS